ncbi:MAG: hypothetical protein AB7U62_03050 [Pseudolabrys sp.]
MIETQPWPGLQRRPLLYKLSGFIGISAGYLIDGWLGALVGLVTIGFWWFGNEEGLDPGYMPAWPRWKRHVFWFFRNFMFNFFRFVIGVEDRDLIVTGPEPVFLPVWHEAQPPRAGWKWAVIRVGWLRLPFASYSGRRVVFYLGWLPSGGRLGMKLNFV